MSGFNTLPPESIVIFVVGVEPLVVVKNSNLPGALSLLGVASIFDNIEAVLQ